MKKSALYLAILLFAAVTVLLTPLNSYAYTFTKVAFDTGESHTLVLRHDGTVWAWGLNSSGQLGDGSTSSHYTPMRVNNLTDVVAIAAGNDFSMALKSDGTVWTWGANNSGQLGDGSTINRFSPVRVTGLTNVIAIAAGKTHSMALRSDGTIWTWGANDYGQLGVGAITGQSSPVQVSNLPNVTAISAGESYSLALKADGTVWAWGLNDSGQLATSSTSYSYAPIQVYGLRNVIAISTGRAHTMALKSDGSLWVWGANTGGQLGDGSSTNRYSPIQVGDLTYVTAISAGENYSLVLKSDGTVFAWGSNEHGQLGDGSTSSRSTPGLVRGLTGATLITAGSDHTLALKLDGTLWTWGTQYDQSGNNPTDRTIPTLVPNLTLVTTCSSIAGGYGFSTMIKKDGTLWSWGSNVHGKLGDGTTINRTSPVQIGSSQNWLKVSSMWEHTAAIKSDGSLWAWGSNEYGQVGDNTTTDRLSPVRIGTDTDWLDVKSSYQHTVALKTDGTLWAWGNNQYGQLGDGTYLNRLTPVKIGTDNDWSLIAVGSYHTVAIKRDGSLWAWGDNRFNQLGDGTTLGKNVPTRIGTANDWAAISAASGHTLALKSNCTLWGWGRQSYGELGDGTTVTRNIPTQIGSENNWAQIKAIWNHTAALKTDGSLWTWGWNNYGQLGTGTTTTALTPCRVGTATDWVSVAGGDAHTIALKQNDNLWAWGFNNSGQLGNGTLANQATPISLSGDNAPVAMNDAVTINEDTPIIINVLANDSDLNGDNLIVSAFTNGSHGTVTPVNNNLRYTPVANYYGSDSFSYQVSDGKSGTATATVTVTILAVNDAPVTTDDLVTVNEDATVLINVLANDTDIDGDSLSIANFTSAAHGVVVRENSNLRYTPAPNFNGADIFTYEVSDGNGASIMATVNITVLSMNDNPVAMNDVVTIEEDGNLVINVCVNDSDIDGDSLNISGFTQGTHGTVTNENNSLHYTPAANYNGLDSFTYTISDGQGGNATATVTVTIEAINDAPVANNDTSAVNEDSTVLINVLANDSDIDGDTLSLTNNFTQGLHGSVIKEANSLRYSPAANYNGTDSFTYQISDGKGGLAVGTVNVTINPINDAPVANNDTPSVYEDSNVLINVLANDRDVDGDTLSIASFTQVGHGTVTKETNSLRYTPVSNYNGTDSFTYQISDGKGGTATATVNITVQPVNDTPVAANDTATTTEDVSVAINVVANDSDLDGDTLTISAFTQGTHGTVVKENNNLRYTPAANYYGIDSFTYTISDGQGGSATATITVTIEAINDAPLAFADTAAVNEDSNVLINVLLNDSDIDGDTLSLTNNFTQGLHGSVIKEVNSLRYSPAANYNGIDSFTYQISDGKGGLAIGTVNVTINPINDAPVANNDASAVNEDSNVLINVLSNDSDIDGDTLSLTNNFTQGLHGSVIKESNSLRYSPAANYNGTDSFTYQISDGKGGTATATVNITVQPVNDTPVASNDTATTNEDVSVAINVVANDSDLDGDTLTISAFTQGTHGTVVKENNNLRYTPAANYYGIDSFTYTISDGQGGSATATVTVTIEAINDAPLAFADTAAVNEDSNVLINVLLNDSDIDGDTLSLTNNFTQGLHGSVIKESNSLRYSPAANYNGTDSFTYQISDGKGGLAVGTVNVTINPINDAPVANNDTSAVNEDSNVLINVLSNDSDIDGDTLSLTTSFTQGLHGSVTKESNSLRYTPAANYNGTDSFTYQVSDGKGGLTVGTVNVTINPINDAPVASNDTSAVNEDANVLIAVLANDSDIDGDTLSIASFTQGGHGTVTKETNSLLYTPLSNYNGTDSFTYQISDGKGGTATATVNVTVQPVNDTPIAVNDTVTVPEDGLIVINVLANDSDVDSDTLSITSFTQGTHGTVTRETNSLRYTPATNYNGTDSFTYQISDGKGGTTSATVNITVQPVNDTPVAANDTATTTEDVSVAINVVANDSDLDGDTLTISGFTQGTHGTVVKENNSLRYTPAANYYGIDSFTYTIADGQGGTATATVNLTIQAVNDAPVAVNDSTAVNEDATILINALTNDSDVDGDLLSIATFTQGSHGTVVKENNSLRYTPFANYFGNDTFNYQISDGKGGTATATIYVTVQPVTDQPIAYSDTVTINEDTTAVVSVLANDIDVDGDSLSISGFSQGGHGTVTLSGNNLLYTPAANYYGSDSFTYYISDGNGGSATATVNITVQSVNDAPIAQNDSAVSDDGAVWIEVLSNDSDVDGDILSICSFTQGSLGSVSQDGNSLLYIPNVGRGTDSFTYQISDGKGGISTAVVTITIFIRKPPLEE